MTEINSWLVSRVLFFPSYDNARFRFLRSHATYYFIAAGCYISLQDYEQAQKLLDKVPEFIEKRKIGGKDLPTEVFIKKKRAYTPLPDELLV